MHATIFDPPHAGWTAMLASQPQRPQWLRTPRDQTIEALDLNPTLPIVASGHQASIWHAGILAKFIALEALPATPVHFVADHDANDPGLIAVPFFKEGVLHEAPWRALRVQTGAATGAQPPMPPTSPPVGSPPAADAIAAALAKETTAPNLAFQVANAAASLAEPWTGIIPRRSISALLQAPIGFALLERLKDDPLAAAEAYNEAIKNTRRVARPLAIDGSLVELPMWRDTPTGRTKVLSNEFAESDSFRPNAMLAIALLRLGACDLYVSGTGGVEYGGAMERWLELWLGADVRAALAPTVVASATITLDHSPAPVQLRTEAYDRILNDPLAEVRGGPSLEKQHLLEAINAAPRLSPERRTAFAALRAWIHQQRHLRAEHLQSLKRLADQARATAHERALAERRVWSFPFVGERDLAALAAASQASAGNGFPR
jgi:hypothetical protein